MIQQQIVSSNASAKPTTKKRPRAQMKSNANSAATKAFEPVPGVEGQRVSNLRSGPAPALHSEELTRTYHVLYRIPRSAKLELKDGKPTRIIVPIADSSFDITGDPEVLGAIEIAKGVAVQGMLTITRSPVAPQKIVSIELAALSSLDEPSIHLRTFANFAENYSFGKGECGTLIRTDELILKLVVTKPVAAWTPAKLAA